MLHLFRSKPSSTLGIDISSTSIKLIQIKRDKGQFIIDAFAMAELPEHSVEANVVKDIPAVANVLKLLIAQNAIGTKKAVLAVPDSAVITKVIQMDASLSGLEMEELVILEADKYIPYAIDEINIDFDIIGSSVKNSELVDVLLVASRAENVNSRVEVVTQAGLEAKVVDVESFAIERVCQLMKDDFPAQGIDKTIAVVDIGAVYTHLHILHNMKVVFTREEEFGCFQLIKEVSKSADVNLKQARRLVESSQLDSSYSEQVLEAFKESVVMQVRRTLQFFFSTSNHSFIDYILLAGGATNIEGIAEILQNQIGITVGIADPVKHFSLSPKIDQSDVLNGAPMMLVCCGLALRHLE